MSVVVIKEYVDPTTKYKYCYAEIIIKRRFWFPKMLHRTPDYPAFSMLLASLADFDRKSKIMDCTKGMQSMNRSERRKVERSISKDLMKD
jgi:hypothetical protein